VDDKRRIVLPSGMSDEQVRRMQELRRSNAAGRHRSKKDYRRRPKHPGRDVTD